MIYIDGGYGDPKTYDNELTKEIIDMFEQIKLEDIEMTNNDMTNSDKMRAAQDAIDIIERQYCTYKCKNWFDGFCADENCLIRTQTLDVLKEMKKDYT